MKKQILILILVLFILTTAGYARTSHIYLLSAIESDNETLGGVADLDLEVTPGKGRVFFQSYPLSQIDTQISTRFAKQYACNFLDIDCSNLDFFYTISSTGPLIGGPSAGAAITVLTIATLEHIDVRQDIVMTGTINSAGMIGPVGGTEAKIEAAKQNGFTQVLIPKWSRLDEDNNNFSLQMNHTQNNLTVQYNLENYLNFKTIDTIKVNYIAEALYHFTGKNYSTTKELEIPEKYDNTMRRFSILLCNKTKRLQKEINFNLKEINYTLESDKIETLINELTNNFTNETFDEYLVTRRLVDAYTHYNNSRNALIKDKPYSAASFCFATNVVLREIELASKNTTTINEIINQTAKEIIKFRDEVNNREIDSIIKLQTKQIVLERLSDSEKLLQEEQTSANVGYAIERLYSARVWYEFFDIKTKKEKIDKELLNDICKTKIMEAQERIVYLRTIMTGDFTELHDKVSTASDLLENNNPEACIYVASQTKAQADLALTTAFLHKVNMTEFFNDKSDIVNNLIANELNQDVFPIAGLSYLEYSESLKEIDLNSAMLYLGYASELGNLRMYFPKDNKFNTLKFYFENTTNVFLTLATGFSFALIILLIYLGIISNQKKK